VRLSLKVLLGLYVNSPEECLREAAECDRFAGLASTLTAQAGREGIGAAEVLGSVDLGMHAPALAGWHSRASSMRHDGRLEMKSGMM